jgi:hypothetical protein
MTQKLWIAFGILGATAFVVLGIGGHPAFPLAEGIAIAGAVCGWAAFLRG